MRYTLTVEFTAEDNDYPGNPADALADAVEHIAPYMVDNVDVVLTKDN